MQQSYQCAGCGVSVPFGFRFCGNCGTQLAWPEQQQTQPVTNSDIPLNTKTGFHVNNVICDSDDKFFLLLYTLKPQILQKFAGGKSLLEIEAELGLPIGMIRAIMNKTKWTVTVYGKTKVIPLKKFTELLRKKGWQIGYGGHCFDENGLLSEASLIGMLSDWTLTMM
jgi:hypothetical protein